MIEYCHFEHECKQGFTSSHGVIAYSTFVIWVTLKGFPHTSENKLVSLVSLPVASLEQPGLLFISICNALLSEIDGVVYPPLATPFVLLIYIFISALLCLFLCSKQLKATNAPFPFHFPIAP